MKAIGQDQDDGGETLMHSAILQFTENNGQQITRQSSTSSSLRPIIGDTVTVHYNQGKLYEPSFILYGVLGLFIFVTGYIVTYAMFFAFGWQRQGVETIGIWAVFYGFIPAGLLLMSVSMLWAVHNFAFGANRADLNGGTAAAISLLGGLIFVALVGYAKIMIKGRKSRMSKIK